MRLLGRVAGIGITGLPGVVARNGRSTPPPDIASVDFAVFENHVEHIFEEFVQLNDYSEGVGIGLTVCRSIVRRLGGDVVLDTEYKDGCRFIITFPILK